MESAKTYKAFLSYSHEDRRWATWLHRALESYRTPKRLTQKTTSAGPVPSRLLPIFRDREELASSHDLSSTITSALANSENLIVICSPSAARSKWVNQEIDEFKRLGKADRIFCFIVDGIPSAANIEQDCFPPALFSSSDALSVPSADNVEPIAADAREEADGKSLAKLKIIAGLLGVGLDELRQRENQRRYRRLTAITAGSVLVSLLTATLAINAMLARSEAEQRKKQAENLLSFMVGDLRSSLEPIGRLDLLEGVGQQALAYFDSVDVSSLSDEELLRQSEVLTQIGEIRMAELKYTDALESFLEAFERSAALVENDPYNGERLFNRGQAEFWVAYVHMLSGTLDDAERWFNGYRDTSLELVTLDPERPDWAREVGYAYHNLAVLAEERGDLDAAAQGFEYEIRTLERLQANSYDPQVQIDIADTVSWLGSLFFERGELEDALLYFERSARAVESVLIEDPDNTILQTRYSESLDRVARAELSMGAFEAALRDVNRAIAIRDILTTTDSTNLFLQFQDLIGRLLRLEALYALDSIHDLPDELDAVIVRLEDFVEENDNDFDFRAYLAQAYQLKSWIEQDEDRLVSALDYSQKAIQTLQPVISADRLNNFSTNVFALSLLSQVELHMGLNNDRDALVGRRELEEFLGGRISEATSPLILDPWIRFLLLSGRIEEGRAIKDETEARHYRPVRPW